MDVGVTERGIGLGRQTLTLTLAHGLLCRHRPSHNQKRKTKETRKEKERRGGRGAIFSLDLHS